jgi:hypothetical protein
MLAVGLVVAAGCAKGGDAGTGFDDGGTGADGVGPLEAGADAKPDLDSTDGSADDATGDAGSSTVDAPSAETSAANDAPAETNDGPDASNDGPDASNDAPTSEAGGGDAGPTLPSPIGAWSFDEGTGTTSADLSGHGHPATLIAGASWTTAGKQGGGLALDGATGYADVGATVIATTGSFSVLAWANLTTLGAWEVVLSEDDATGSLFGLKLRGDGSNQYDFDVERTDVTSPVFVVAQSTSVAPAATWVHLAGVYDTGGNGALRLYVNCALQSNAAVGQPLLAATGHLLIGRGLYNGAAGSYLHGTIDEVAVYGVALSDAQVGAVYAAQK